MEIKCKVSFTLPEDLIEALGIDEDTPIIASVSGNRILLEIADEPHLHFAVYANGDTIDPAEFIR